MPNPFWQYPPAEAPVSAVYGTRLLLLHQRVFLVRYVLREREGEAEPADRLPVSSLDSTTHGCVRFIFCFACLPHPCVCACVAQPPSKKQKEGKKRNEQTHTHTHPLKANSKKPKKSHHTTRTHHPYHHPSIHPSP